MLCKYNGVACVYVYSFHFIELKHIGAASFDHRQYYTVHGMMAGPFKKKKKLKTNGKHMKNKHKK